MGDKFLPNNEQEAEDLLRKRLKFKKMTVDSDSSALWNRIREDIQEEPPVRSIRSARIRTLFKLVAAASVVLILAFVFLWPSGVETYQAPMAETLELSLPDESTVVVNAASELRYDVDNWAEDRKVQLKGEAFFQVQKGKRFVVETKMGEVEVLGTAFNVFSRGNTFSVSCQEGRVAVRNVSGEQTSILSAGDAASLVNGQWQREQTTSESIATWRAGLFVYESKGIATILEEMERQYNVVIDFPIEIAEEKITMRFEKNQSLEAALEPILFPYRLSFKRSGKKIVLDKNE